MRITNTQIEEHLPLLTDRLSIRKVQLEDAEQLFKAYTSNPKVAALSSWTTHSSIADTSDFVEYGLSKWKQSEEFNFCLCLRKQPDQVIGMFKIKQTEDVVNIGYVLGEKYWNKGLATEAVSAFCDFLFSFPEISEIQALTDPLNDASAAVLKKAGFHYSTKLIKNIIRPQISSEPRDSLVFSLHK